MTDKQNKDHANNGQTIDGPEIDSHSGVETTGHDWDGIKELNNPMPRWWLISFYATIIFAIGYMIAYPSIPLISSATKGVLNWSSRAEVSSELADARDAQVQFWEQLDQTDVTEIAANQDLLRFSIAGGNAAYKVNCVQCHGSGAQGSPGYPNLNDDDWIWGGDIKEIYLTINHGVRHEDDDDTRYSDMPAYGRDGIFDRQTIIDVAWYVRELSGQDFDQEAAARGKGPYLDNCAACHGTAGTGDRELGAPNLGDALWLYGGEHSQIMSQIHSPQQGVMPAWGQRLGDATTKQLAVFIHSLGGGE